MTPAEEVERVASQKRELAKSEVLHRQLLDFASKLEDFVVTLRVEDDRKGAAPQ